MKLGYPCINRVLSCRTTKGFRLAGYSDDRLRQVVSGNLQCLATILQWNVDRGLLFFRISSDVVPFASHPICRVNWQGEFAHQLKEIGAFIQKNGLRISMHPDQFNVLNSLKTDVVERTVRELQYHADLLDGMGLDSTAKIQVHVGGAYDDTVASMGRWAKTYQRLPAAIKNRLVIENDDRLFSLKDCLIIHEKTKVPILFDFFHHSLFNRGETRAEAIQLAQKTWTEKDGLLMADYSTQEPGKRAGTHAETIDLTHFEQLMREVKDLDFDLMLEIKDKEKSALKVVKM